LSTFKVHSLSFLFAFHVILIKTEQEKENAGDFLTPTCTTPPLSKYLKAFPSFIKKRRRGRRRRREQGFNNCYWIGEHS
jgi:hypothetical protein